MESSQPLRGLWLCRRHETGEQEAINRPPRRPLDLALEAADLVPENQKLKSELGLRVAPIDEGIEE